MVYIQNENEITAHLLLERFQAYKFSTSSKKKALDPTTMEFETIGSYKAESYRKSGMHEMTR